jgi:hypothetical protein
LHGGGQTQHVAGRDGQSGPVADARAGVRVQQVLGDHHPHAVLDLLHAQQSQPGPEAEGERQQQEVGREHGRPQPQGTHVPWGQCPVDREPHQHRHQGLADLVAHQQERGGDRVCG